MQWIEASSLRVLEWWGSIWCVKHSPPSVCVGELTRERPSRLVGATSRTCTDTAGSGMATGDAFNSVLLVVDLNELEVEEA